VIGSLVSTELMDLVQRSLDAASVSHKVISDNLANVDTPGFKRSEVIFGDKLKRAMEARAKAQESLAASKTDNRHLAFDPAPELSSVEMEVKTDLTTSLRNDGNNVDIDREVSLLAQNTVWYQTLAQITQMQFSGLKTAISEGRK
jgi:flagellar basal-body rod protein FlgB